jgi:hypothetical protein
VKSDKWDSIDFSVQYGQFLLGSQIVEHISVTYLMSDLFIYFIFDTNEP